MSLLPNIEVNPTSKATASVIWLHGLGADGSDFEAIVPQLNLPKDSSIRFIFPNAPAIPVTINGGFVMPAWYDILEMNIERKVDEQQLMQSAKAVHALIDHEIARGIDSRRIILAGFSQGGAVCYQAALSYDKPLGGLIAMSTYFATAHTVALNAANRSLPIHIYHGSRDAMVAESLGHKAKQTLQAMAFTPAYDTYTMEHEVCLEQIADISRQLQTWLTVS